MEVFTKNCHRDLFKHQQTDLNRPKSIGKALCKPRNKDRKNGNKDRNCYPYSRKHGKRHVESQTEAVSFLAKPNIHQMAKSGKDKIRRSVKEGVINLFLARPCKVKILVAKTFIFSAALQGLKDYAKLPQYAPAFKPNFDALSRPAQPTPQSPPLNLKMQHYYSFLQHNCYFHGTRDGTVWAKQEKLKPVLFGLSAHLL